MDDTSDHPFALQPDHNLLIGTEIHVHRSLFPVVSCVIGHSHADKLLETVAAEISNEAAGGV